MVYSKDFDSAKEKKPHQGGRFASPAQNISNKANTARLQGEPTFEVIDPSGNRVKYNTAQYKQYQETQRQQKQQQQKQQQQKQQEIQRQQKIQRDNRRELQTKAIPTGFRDAESRQNKTQKLLSTRRGIKPIPWSPERLDDVRPPTTVSIDESRPLNLASIPKKSKTVSVKKVKQGAAMAVSGSEAVAQNPVIQNIIKSSNISLKGETAKIVKEKKLKSDPNRQLKPLESQADFIETVKRPVENFARYIIAAPVAVKKIVETGDPLAGEKYYTEQVQPKMKETASSRLFSGDFESLTDPNKLAENLISGGVEVGMYAFTGGKGKAAVKPKTPIIKSPPAPTFPKGTYQPRQVPKNVFKADKAEPNPFQETKIGLGKGTGQTSKSDKGGFSFGTGPRGKPPSAFTSKKTSLGSGLEKSTESLTVTKDGQLLIQKTKQTTPTKTKQATKKKTDLKQEQQFSQTTVKLGEAEANLVKQTQKQTSELYPLQTPKSKLKKKQKQQESQYFQVSEIVKPKQAQDEQYKFAVAQIMKPKQAQKAKPKQKQEERFAFIPGQKQATKQTFDTPFFPKQTYSFGPTTPPAKPLPPARSLPFPFYAPRGYFGSGGFEDPASLKKAYATYGISSDINIKTLPTYSRYSKGTGIFKKQRSEDEYIQSLYYGKKPKSSKTSKKKTSTTKKSKSKKSGSKKSKTTKQKSRKR